MLNGTRTRPSGSEGDDPPPAAILLPDPGESFQHALLELSPRPEPRRGHVAAHPCRHNKLEHLLESTVFFRSPFGLLISFCQDRHPPVSLDQPRHQDCDDTARIILVQLVNNSRRREFLATRSVGFGGHLGGPDLPDPRAGQDLVKSDVMLGPEGAQNSGLLFTKRGKLVIVAFKKRSLAVAHKDQYAHGSTKSRAAVNDQDLAGHE